MSAIIVALIMIGVGAICFGRAASPGWRETIEDRKAFLLFCLIFGAGSLALAVAAWPAQGLFWSRMTGGALLLCAAALVLWRGR
jgi:hypothetical protein